MEQVGQGYGPEPGYTRERYEGALAGLAVGDAVGVTLEFTKPGAFQPIDDMVGGGPFGLKPGEWTDDTSMALCLADSLLACGGFDPLDQMRRYRDWYRNGYRSSKGYCFDIGNATAEAIERFERTGKPFSGSTDPYSAGNGAIMRLAPVPLYYAANTAEAVRFSAESSMTTHGALECVDACKYLGALIVGAVSGYSKERLLGGELDLPADEPLADAIEAIRGGSFKRKQPPDIRGTGYVVQSLEAALWAFHNSGSFKEGLLLAVNLGEDSDTTGAVYGQLAGAHYGISSIPASWLDKLVMKETILELAGKLFERCRHTNEGSKQ
ncbi:ADP-ribosylglycohydrolase family protein [Paenibacillus mesophilus]|uniref:ADP-ribosylglycohydrolase family protein n=1 Tax=Paenibacillus mesophilus TaxID=2582849 RepID=UPI00110D62FC|nr:ADP-ribosylglycohydrolase family protein [Paenibacillus mesophilus]TMV45818.1 ADP-ribosylglycohydrolase family protein [Paenibacillus mesophilus]